MAPKVSFDPLTKIITVTEPPDLEGFVDINVKVDLYSDGKEEWKSNPTLNKFRFFMRAVGGDPIPGSRVLGSTFFLLHGWRIRPYEASHTLRIDGNLYTEEGDSPYLSVLGPYTVMVISSVSSLVDSSVTQLPQTVATAVWSEDPTAFPAGSVGEQITAINSNAGLIPALI